MDAGAAWYDNIDGNGTADTNGTVNTFTLGTYKITYSFTDSSGNTAQSVVRTVTVVDTTPPVITLIGDDRVTHPASSTYIDHGAHWSDIIDGQGEATATGLVDIDKPGTYEISYSAVDQSGNFADPIYRIINVVDQDPPILTLLGDANITHEAGYEYLDAGAVSYDNIDGNGTADTNGTVNTFTLGTYKITYSFTDSSGNTAQSVVRTVTVVDTTPPVITLIGDDRVTHPASSTYIEHGAHWSDIIDGQERLLPLALLISINRAHTRSHTLQLIKAEILQTQSIVLSM